MIKKFILSTLIICSCSTPANKANTINDTLRINTVRELFTYLKQADSIVLHTNDSTLLAENIRLKEKIKATIDYSLNSKELEIKNNYLTDKLAEIREQKKNVEKRIDILTDKNETLIRQNENYKITLINEYEKKTNILIDKAILEKSLNEAKRLVITSLKITGIGYSFFNKEIQTSSSNKLKKIKITFSLPINTIANRETKNIDVFLYKKNRKDFIKGDTTINYIGNECDITILLIGTQQFEIGTHPISIYINNKLQTEEQFKVID